MGASEVAEGEAILNASGIPTFQYPDAAARSFCYMWRYSDNLRALYETPALSAGGPDNSAGRAGVETMIRAAREINRTLLTETESKLILEAYEWHTSGAGGARGAVMLGDEMIDEASRKMALVIAGKGRAAGMTRTADPYRPPG